MTGHEVALVAVAALIVTASHYACAMAGIKLGRRSAARQFENELRGIVATNNEHLKTVMDLQARLRVAVAQAEAAGIAPPLGGGLN